MNVPVFDTPDSIPRKCGDLNLYDVEVYQDLRFGVGIRYQASSGTSERADVYLYDFGLKDVPADIKSPEMLNFFRGACQDVYASAEMGQYDHFKMLSSQYIHLPPNSPDPFCLWAVFSFEQPLGPNVFFTGKQTSHLAMRSDRGYINKVRYSYPTLDTEEEIGFKRFLRFFLEWTALVQKHSDSVKG